MKRAVLMGVVLAVLLLAWLLREDDVARGSRGAGARRGQSPIVTTPVDAAERGPDREQPEPGELGRVSIRGSVVGPSGPVWGATVRVHKQGSPTPFDETGTKSDGTYLLELTIPAQGETVDLSVAVAPDVSLVSSQFNDIELRAGDKVERNFTLTNAPFIEGRVRVNSRARGRRRVGLVRLADWEALVAESNGAYPEGKTPKFLEVRSTAARFRFTKVPPGRYVVICDDPYAVSLAPPIVEPGGEYVVIPVTRLASSHIVVRDLETGQPVDVASVTLVDFPAGAPFTSVTGKGAGFKLRLRAAGPKPKVRQRVRVRSEGYHDSIRLVEPWRNIVLFPNDEALVALSAPVLTIHFQGGGAATLADQVIVATRATLNFPGTSRTYLATEFPPMLDGDARKLRVALPVGDWPIRFFGKEELLGGSSDFTVSIRASGENEVFVEMPEPATITIDWSNVKMPKWNQLWLIGGHVAWTLGQDGVFRLAQDPGTQTKIMLHQPTMRRESARTTFEIFPGQWTLVRRNITDARTKTPLTLTPGERITFAFGQ